MINILATGSYLPDNIITNNDLAKVMDTTDEWITQRTGIRQRHFASQQLLSLGATSHMATQAAKTAIARANLDNNQIDAIIVATTTPDKVFPATALLVKEKLGINNHVMAFDLQAVCSGFMYGLEVAHGMLLANASYNNILLIGAETMSTLLDFSDRTTAVLFGDGAGAVILGRQEGRGGIIDIQNHSDQSGIGKLYADKYIIMNGQEVFKYAVKAMSSVVSDILRKNNIAKESIDWLVPHQANERIIDGVAKKLSPTKVVKTVALHANTSAASIPLALDYAVNNGDIIRGNRILLESMGAGFTWGAAIVDF